MGMLVQGEFQYESRRQCVQRMDHRVQCAECAMQSPLRLQVVTMGQRHGPLATGRRFMNRFLSAVSQHCSQQTDTAAAAHTSRLSLCVAMIIAIATAMVWPSTNYRSLTAHLHVTCMLLDTLPLHLFTDAVMTMAVHMSVARVLLRKSCFTQCAFSCITTKF